jgi:hypothetical protein
VLQLLQALGPVVREAGPQGPMSNLYQSVNSAIICIAAQYGQLECLRYLTTPVGAAAGAHHIQETDRCAVSRSAATGGHVPILQWLQQQGFLQENVASHQADVTRHHGLCALAAAHGCMDVVVWLHQQGFELGPLACRGAARAGHLQLLQWLRSHGVEWEPERIVVAAAAGGSVSVLQFLQESSVGQWNTAALTRLLRVAGRHGQLAAAQWLYSAGGALPDSMWDVDVCFLHLTTLQWAIEQEGVPWGASPPPNTCYWLLNQMPEEVWEWAHENGCSCNCNDELPIPHIEG